MHALSLSLTILGASPAFIRIPNITQRSWPAGRTALLSKRRDGLACVRAAFDAEQLLYLLCRGRAERWQRPGPGWDGFQPSPSRPGSCNNQDVKEEDHRWGGGRSLYIHKCLKSKSLTVKSKVFSSVALWTSHLLGAYLRSDLFLGSTHHQNFSESKVRLQTHWWHINIRLEDMGILAGVCRGCNLKDLQPVAPGPGGDGWSGSWGFLENSLSVVF